MPSGPLRTANVRRHSMYITTAVMRSTAAEYRRAIEETRSTIAASTASIRYVNALLHDPMLKLGLTSIN